MKKMIIKIIKSHSRYILVLQEIVYRYNSLFSFVIIILHYILFLLTIKYYS